MMNTNTAIAAMTALAAPRTWPTRSQASWVMTLMAIALIIINALTQSSRRARLRNVMEPLHPK
ncbi:hypothetical protein D3C87_2120050 [compost metagenome]